MNKWWRIVGRAAGIMSLLSGLLFVVYFWNLDRTLLNRAYKKINQLFESRK